MNISHSHINEYLGHFAKVNGDQFEDIFNRVKNPSKVPLRALLSYINNLMDSLLDTSSLTLTYHHIHFPGFVLDSEVILEFLCIKFFLLNFFQDANSEVETDNYYENHSIRIGNFLRAPLALAVGEGKRVEKRNKDKRKRLRSLLKDLNSLQEFRSGRRISVVKPKCLFNISSGTLENMYGPEHSCPYYVSVDYLLKDDLSKPLSYVLLNADRSLSDLDNIKIRDQNEFLEDIKNIFIFDSESKKNNFQYNYSKLVDFNKCGTNFNNLIVFSFDRRPLRLNRLISQHVKISSRYYERPSSVGIAAYTILPYELQKLSQRKVQEDIDIQFVGENSHVWRNLRNRIYQYEDLNELVSIKMRNIYSLCYTEKYKSLVLNDLFSDQTSISYLLSPDAKQRIDVLNYQEKEEILILLTGVLDLVIHLNIPSFILKNRFDSANTFVLPYLVVNHVQLLEEVKSRLGDSSELTIATWKTITNFNSANVIILEYRDPGRSPYLIYPSLLENSIKADFIKAYLIKDFFEINYGYSFFEYNRTLYQNILTNETRECYFKWYELSKKIESLKPVPIVSTDLLDLDDDYTGQGEKESIFIKFKSGGKKGFHPSQLFVYKDIEDGQLSSIKAEDLIEEGRNKSIFAQPLDELYEGLKLFQATMEEEAEIHHLKKSFNINENDAEQRIWKILLKRKSEKFGVIDTYVQLKKHMEEKRLPMVREDYFANYWLEVASDMLIPRSKRVFQVICNYLNLPEVYLIVMLKKRARERFATRKSTNKMNQLIAALVDKGLFDINPPILKFDGSFLAKYELEEIGINELNLAKEITALVELLKPNLDFKEIKTLERKKI